MPCSRNEAAACASSGSASLSPDRKKASPPTCSSVGPSPDRHLSMIQLSRTLRTSPPQVLPTPPACAPRPDVAAPRRESPRRCAGTGSFGSITTWCVLGGARPGAGGGASAAAGASALKADASRPAGIRARAPSSAKVDPVRRACSSVSSAAGPRVSPLLGAASDIMRSAANIPPCCRLPSAPADPGAAPVSQRAHHAAATHGVATSRSSPRQRSSTLRTTRA
mmetsp:Transcript_26587/g.85255  ORF Transcript_26587/g.85255 Transcript_26587/m.85255 type:complete len:223 (-) Transcript_26587:444-1112(-)|eukprot:CAMPEP_0182884234 /NCGR_PEP_ID=MMETSP0034_2-20130328/18867_1 /TAXON_ID=156128 /ORGANISM="Nephroselmis pyriformis, Strain CCMP717" /LENGTH=222 /DNA_ID=CAMNT_0025017415 /DNA_START=146 /DNA_END=814 /DNA_ORIENTATION=-